MPRHLLPRHLPHTLRRPLTAAAAALAVVAVSGGGYVASAAPAAQTRAAVVLDAGQLRALEQQAQAADADEEFQRSAAATAEADRAAQRAAEAEAARQAQLEAERQAEAEAERQAAAQRQAAAEQASRDAARDPRSAARVMVAERGWGAGQFDCLDALWQRESNWKHTADNPTSSAYGIPQALPGEKMASAGADWRTNPVTQIRWGLGYIADVYGSPCAALSHSDANNWY